METDLSVEKSIMYDLEADKISHRVIRTQELTDDHCQYFIYQVSLPSPISRLPSPSSIYPVFHYPLIYPLIYPLSP